MGYQRTRLVLLVLSLVVVGTSASETEEGQDSWRLDHGHHHHGMMEVLCGKNGERCDHERMDRMHSFWHQGKPCGKLMKYPRHWGPRETDEGKTTVTSVMQGTDGINERKVVIMLHPVLGRRAGPFGIEGDDVPELMKHVVEHMMQQSREMRRHYINMISEQEDTRWTGLEDMMMSKVHALLKANKHLVDSSSSVEVEKQEQGWKQWFHHCMNKIRAKTSMFDNSNTADDSIMSSLKGIDWRLWDEEGHLNTGLVLFIALVCTSAAIWTSLMIQLIQYIFFYYHCSEEYDELDTPSEKVKECSDVSETKGLLEGQEPHVK